MGVYVEVLIRAPMDAVWEHTQTPSLHEQWDLRFSRIEHLPKADGDERQRFRYSTRLGFGLEISGEGETAGSRDLENGSRSSALTFSSADPRSIIDTGSGYWKYIPTDRGVRFLTWYDYRTRFGLAGTLFDRLIFRPLERVVLHRALSPGRHVEAEHDEAARCFRVVFDVRNRVWGRLFGYRGQFTVEWRPVRTGEVPAHILPRPQERRE